MSGADRKPYLSATSLTQALLNACADNLECRLEMIVDIETPTGIIRASDRNKYVGGTFYEALLNFPQIGRTVGEWLANELQFSTLTVELSNVDGRFNEFLPGGANYGGWIGKAVTVKLGLAEQASTYTTIFKGSITDVGGFKRTVRSIIIIARDDFDRTNQAFPVAAFIEADYPKIEPKNIGKLMPIIYGDWTVATEPAPASVPAFVVNGNDPLVNFKDKSVEISGPAAPAVFTCASHSFDNNDPVQLLTSGTLPAPFALLTTYYVRNGAQDSFELATAPFGASIASTTGGAGDHRVAPEPSAARRPVQFRVSENNLASFDQENVYLKRGDTYFAVPNSEITMLFGGNKEFEIAQNTANLWADGAAFLFDLSDAFFVRVEGKELGGVDLGFDTNLIAQARDILKAYGGLVDGDFHSSWTAYRDKASPAQSAIYNFKSRVWLDEATPALTYALSMLEQVRLEAFINRDLKLKINSLHFEDWSAATVFTVKDWDIVKDSFQTSIDERTNFNAAQGVFNFLPDVAQNAYSTAAYQNPLAISQVGKRIGKRLIYPNLYEKAVVINQVIESLRLASSTLEVAMCSLTWRALLRDIGNFVTFNVQIGSAILDNVPAMLREVGYNPSGLTVVVKAWLLGMVPFPGYTPGYPGTVGGYSATIDEES